MSSEKSGTDTLLANAATQEGTIPLSDEELGRNAASGPSRALALSVKAKRALWIVAIGVFLVLTITLAVLFSRGYSDDQIIVDDVKPLRVKNAAVSSGNTVCNEIGVEVLQEGGNAFDAAIAVAICLGPRNFVSSGIGGGSVTVLRLSNGTVFNIDGREVAPAAANQDMFNNTPSAFGGLSIAVPGEIRLLGELYRKFGSGKVSWRRLLQPTINFTRNGWEIEKFLWTTIHNPKYEQHLSEPQLANVFKPNGTLLDYGQLVRLPLLAATLDHIASLGPDVFYTANGLTQTMVEEINAAGGNFTLNDITSYTLQYREPIISTYKNYTVIGAYPPLSGGPCIGQILNMLEGWDMSGLGYGPDAVHLIAETFKFAFANRMGLGDPAFVANVSTLVPLMISKVHAELLNTRVSLTTTYPPEHYFDLTKKRDIPMDLGTTHISIVDADRNTISITTTINEVFGSRVYGPRTGIMYNNEMDDFSKPGQPNGYGLAPSVPNFIAPGKRPLSSMSPTIILDDKGELFMTLGGAGGPRILTATLQMIVYVIDFHLNIAEALELPRIHHQLYPNQISMEPRRLLSVELQDALAKKGHVIVETASWANIHGIVRTADDWLEAASDWRKYAHSAGY